tara:strand:+ start:119 stop:1090 length:972 start_codon:yes stop_codon:yes gene_type:complete
MAYTAGDQILDDEYNNFVGSSSSPFGINHISGTGSAEYGLGESSVATVSAGDTINASQWNTLFAAMNVCAAHTADSITSTGSKSAGDAIAIISALTTDLATLAASVAAGSPNTTAVTTSSALQQPTSSSTWSNSFTTEMSVTFANANKMRHFFNAGGKVRVYAEVTGSGLSGDGSGPGIDASWTAIYNALGNLDIGSQTSTRSGSGETLTTNGLANGFHDLGTGYTEIIKISDDTYPYASNNISVQAKLDAAVGSAVTMTVKMVATDGTSNFTYTGGNAEGSDSQSYRNGTHRHNLKVTSTTTASLANAHAQSSTATASNSTS